MTISKHTLVVVLIPTIALLIIGLILLDKHYDAYANGLDYTATLEKIIIPDTYLYLISLDAFYEDTLSSINNIKNVIAPAFFWYVADGSWLLSVVFNVFCIFLTLIALSKLAILLGNRLPVLFGFALALNPETIFYTQGMLKEIPSLMLLSFLALFYIRRQIGYVFIIGVLLSTIRFQYSIVVLTLIALSFLPVKKQFISAIVGLSVFASLFPILFDYIPGLDFDVGLLYREYSPGTGFGGFIYHIKFYEPGISVFGWLVSIGQGLLEPFPIFNTEHNGLPSFYDIALNYSFFFMLYFYIASFIALFNAIIKYDSYSQEQIKLCVIAILFIGAIGFDSFIHHRYYYPMFGMLILLPLTLRNKNITSSVNAKN